MSTRGCFTHGVVESVPPSSSPPTGPVSRPRSVCARRARFAASVSSTRSSTASSTACGVARPNANGAASCAGAATLAGSPSALSRTRARASRHRRGSCDVERHRTDTGDERVDAERSPTPPTCSRTSSTVPTSRPVRKLGEIDPAITPRRRLSTPYARSAARGHARPRRTARRGRANATRSPDHDRPARTHDPRRRRAPGTRRASTSSTCSNRRPVRPTSAEQAITLSADEHTRARLLDRPGRQSRGVARDGACPRT